MFHLPHILFAEIHQYLVEFAVVAATGISVYQFLSSKLKQPKSRTRSRRTSHETRK